ncbi:large subunit ribosomal protein L24 [Geosmithia morbida]|uniref:Large subunit ribosomal protein L24 n=1 Tax=Geosmithia morbida TaxID=1094350 RepID=A0A9P4YTV0_9HYPO|nr:large subunit ribosomal protein L24 [Geosmithia morbida]KAF4121960.1 large subunit ribosomal protein L24 [Geosmithia morbida]
MEKLVKRTVQAQRQAGRRAHQSIRRHRNTQRWEMVRMLKSTNNEIRQNLSDARKARYEDWVMGPLAPKRDLGYNVYGTITEPTRLTHESGSGVHSIRPHVVAKRCEWAGSPHQLNLAVGDRIVILEGRDRGKLDRIESINSELGTVTLMENNKGLHKTPIGDREQLTALPMSIGAIRLVYPLPDPATGTTKDTIIHQLKATPPNMQSENMTLDRWEHGNKWDRVVPGINVVIPWPEVKVPQFVTHDVDTARDQVEDRSFYYNLLSPPMPPQALDELRNKYSKFRTRHEGWYVAKKEEEAAAKKGRHNLLLAMRTPGEELGIKRREAKAARGEPELSDDMLLKLGEIIAQSKAASLEDAGVAQVAGEGDETESR